MSSRAQHLAWYVVAAALVVVLAGVAGYGPLHFMKRTTAGSTPAVSVPATAPVGGSTTTTFEVERRSYRRGDCVTFDQTPGEGTRTTDVVDCDRPHLMEMAESVDVAGRSDHFPSVREWAALVDRDCAAGIRALLGAPLDPVGRFYPVSIQPTHESWHVGDRTMWCAVGYRPLTRPPNLLIQTPFRGRAETTPQARVFPTGSCWSRGSDFVTPCARSHEWEVSGQVDLSGRVELPPATDDVAAWQRLVGDDCQRLARAYLGHDLVGDQGAGWDPIRLGSWSAGRRAVECTVARYRGGRVLPTVGSLRA
jgi:Septum formation